MKTAKRNNFFLPEEKKYLLWVLLVLVAILLLQILIYPKIRKGNTFNTLIQTFRSDINNMNNQISETMMKKENIEKTQQILNEKLSYRGDLSELIKRKVINNLPSTFELIDLSLAKQIDSNETTMVPGSLEFKCNKADLALFLRKLNELPIPTEIVDMKIDGLSPNNISVRIQLILEKRKYE